MAEFDRQPGRLAARTLIKARVQAAFEREGCEYRLEHLARRRALDELARTSVVQLAEAEPRAA